MLVPLADVLTITTGIMLSERGILGVRGITAFLIGVSKDLDDCSITDTVCVAVQQKCAEGLIQQYPWLANISGNNVTPKNVDAWTRQIIDAHGMYINVEPLR